MTAPCLTPVNGLPPVGTLATVYLGKPGAMTKLRVPDAKYAGPANRGEVAHALAGGGVTVTRRDRTKRVWTLPFSGMTPDDAEALVSYYVGGRGLGPFAMIDPAWRNQLGRNASTFGVVPGVNAVWNPATADTAPLLDATIAPAIPGSAVLRWPAPILNHYLFEGTQPGGILTPSLLAAVPYLTDQAAVVSVYARTATSTANVILDGMGVAVAGWDTTSVIGGGTQALNTTWKRLVTVVPLGTWAATMAFLCAAIQAKSTGGPDLLFSNAQIEFGVTAATPWVTGLGVARVSLSSGLASALTSAYWRRDHALTASEN